MLQCHSPSYFIHKHRFLFTILAIALMSVPSVYGACVDDTWTATSNTNAPQARYLHTAVWTGTEMIVWGGVETFCCSVFATGGRYNPAADAWTATSNVNAPEGRYNHTAIWTGSKMIVWGGFGFSTNNPVNTGGIYDPLTDTWTATSTVNAPSARQVHSAIWTGTEMIIWGGQTTQSNYDNSGSKYNPATDTWTPVSLKKVPVPRQRHTAVWTGREMIVWGGFTNSGVTSTGGRYNPSTDSWKPTSVRNAPQERCCQTAIPAGAQMIVWGGVFIDEDDPFLNTGGRLSRNTWLPTSTTDTDTPAQRAEHTAVWTGEEMIIWGGVNYTEEGGGLYQYTGGRYNPATDSWVATTLTNLPAGRREHTAVWTGQEMVIWGGLGDFGVLSTGARYCAN